MLQQFEYRSNLPTELIMLIKFNKNSFHHSTQMQEMTA